MSGRFHTITLGCKLNQFDGAALEGELERRGLLPVADPAGATVVVVNTCTVTHRADADARKIVRSVRRENPACKLLVTGCYAESSPDELAALEGVDHVFGNREKPAFDRVLDRLGIGVAPEDGATGLGIGGGDGPDERADRGCDARLPPALHFGERSRAFLKVQDGCRLACSYCVIPAVRGPSRSVAPEAVIAAARSLFDRGFDEIVLTGVNTGDYGRDLTPRTNLAALLRRLLAVAGDRRVRLNSVEPLAVTPELIALFGVETGLAPHLQVPLQSGADPVLRRMRRNYRVGQYARTLEALRAARPEIALGADLIVGFPGETEALFEESRDFVAASPLNYLHVFSWSPRPGVPAVDLDGRVHSRVIRHRSSRMRDLGRTLGRRFRERFVGRTLDAVILGPRRGGSTTRALTGNFIEVDLQGEAPARGRLASVRIERVDADRTLAVAV